MTQENSGMMRTRQSPVGSYLLKIYRAELAETGCLTGTLENLQSEEKYVFHDTPELLDLLGLKCSVVDVDPKKG